MLTVAGDQVPTTPFGEVLAKLGAGDPKQIGAIGTKFGTVSAFTVTASVYEGAVTHSEAAGVKV